MITFREVNIKNRLHYFFNDMTNIKNFDPSLLGIDKISFKSTDAVIYHIGYITMKSLDKKKIDTANSVYRIFNNVNGYIECNSTEGSNEDKFSRHKQNSNMTNLSIGIKALNILLAKKMIILLDRYVLFCLK